MRREVRVEVEIKLAVDDAEQAAAMLADAGAVATSPRALEDNRLFDLPGRPLTAAGRLLRVREYAGRVIVTAKAPPGGRGEGNDRYKERHESEIVVEDAAAMVAVLEAAGFELLWRYQKYRRVWAWDGAEVMLDETPAGAFLEIEGERDVIERLVERIGARAGARRTDTYRDVWEAHCAARGIEAGDMVFEGERC